jgi:integrase
MAKRGHSSEHALNQGQIQQLITTCQTLEERVLVKLPLFCGLRSGEIAHLKASWVTPEGYLKIPREQPCNCWECANSPHPGHWQPKTKAGARTLPIVQQLYPDLMGFLKKSPDGFGLTRVNVYHHIKAILRKAGLPNSYPHSLRATCFSILAASGMSAPALAAFAGWSNLAVAQVYIDLVQAQQAAINQATRIFGGM